MKCLNHFVLLLICSLFCGICDAQTSKTSDNKPQAPNNECIVLDALNCCVNTQVPQFIKENSRVSVKVLNVNPLMVKMKVTTSVDTINFGAFPTVFNLEFDKSDEAKTAASDGATKDSGIVAELVGPKKKDDKKAEKAKAKKEEQAAAKIALKRCQDSLEHRIYNLQRFLNLESRIKTIVSTPIARKADLKKRIADELACFKPPCDTCCCWYHDRYLEYIDSIRNHFDCVTTQYKIVADKAALTQKVKVSGEIKINKGSVKIKEQQVSITEETSTGLDEDYKAIKKLVETILGDSMRKLMDAKIQSLSDLCNDFNNADSFVVCENLPSPTGDIYKLNSVIITGPKKDTIWQMPEMSFRTYGGHRLNFSTGIGVRFFGLDKTFFKEKINADTFRIRAGNAKNAGLLSIAAFLHSYRTTTHRWQPAWTLGFSTNPASLETTRIFFGASLIRGEKKRWVFSAGITVGPTDVLKGKLEEDKQYAYADYSGLEDNDLTEKKIRINSFFGISYNLSVK